MRERRTGLKRTLRDEERPLCARGLDPTVDDDSVVLACEFGGEFPQKNTDSATYTFLTCRDSVARPSPVSRQTYGR